MQIAVLQTLMSRHSSCFSPSFDKHIEVELPSITSAASMSDSFPSPSSPFPHVFSIFSNSPRIRSCRLLEFSGLAFLLEKLTWASKVVQTHQPSVVTNVDCRFLFIPRKHGNLNPSRKAIKVSWTPPEFVFDGCTSMIRVLTSSSVNASSSFTERSYTAPLFFPFHKPL